MFFHKPFSVTTKSSHRRETLSNGYVPSLREGTLCSGDKIFPELSQVSLLEGYLTPNSKTLLFHKMEKQACTLRGLGH